MEIKRYCGNAKPFVYALFHESDMAKANEVLVNLCKEKYLVWFENVFDEKSQKRMEKASIVMLFMSPAASSEDRVNEAISFAVMKNIPIITVYLIPTEMTPSQKLQLNTYQGLMKYSFEGEELFYEKLYKSSAMQFSTITTAQKKSARRKSTVSWVVAAAVVFVIAFIVLLSSVGGLVEAGTLMANCGYTGALSDITDIYIYATKTMDANHGASHPLTEDDTDYIQINDTGEKLVKGEVEDISDFSQLKRLKNLVFTGNALNDISPLYKLRHLEILDISCNPIKNLDGIDNAEALKTLNIAYTDVIDLTPLMNCPSLESVYVSCNMKAIIKNMDVSFKVVFADHTWSEWNTIMEATYKQEGQLQRSCLTCGKIEIKTSPVIEHEHTWSDWDVLVESTYTQEGQTQRSCLTCGETETGVIPITDLANPGIDKLTPHIFGGKEEWGDTAADYLYGIYIFGVNTEYTYVFKKNGVVVDCSGREYVDDDGDGLTNKTHIMPDPLQMGSYDPTATYTLEVYGDVESYIYTIRHKFD
ncbi:MAG: hypothetical protein PHV32_05345 [Eubacteriales bacterium]|nr:hypothetical protein [Eubacteriales bacterium]